MWMVELYPEMRKNRMRTSMEEKIMCLHGWLKYQISKLLAVLAQGASWDFGQVVGQVYGLLEASPELEKSFLSSCVWSLADRPSVAGFGSALCGPRHKAANDTAVCFPQRQRWKRETQLSVKATVVYGRIPDVTFQHFCHVPPSTQTKPGTMREGTAQRCESREAGRLGDRRPRWRGAEDTLLTARSKE